MSTNHEPNNKNKIPDDILYFERLNLPYEDTEWGKFYVNYTEKNNLQIQKFLLKVENEFSKVDSIKHSAYRKMGKFRLVKRWFRNTDIDQHGKPCTPQRILGDMGFDYNEVAYTFLKRRVTRELNEVKSFYNNRKIELSEQNKTHRRERAKERVECPICKAKITRTNLAQHRKSNQFCQRLATDVACQSLTIANSNVF